ncbi:MAG: bifunctional TVP38/TMEM64 family protein/FAD-dependent oxidoreductase [Rhodoferax sp.]
MLLVAAALLVLGFYALGWNESLTLQGVQARLAHWEALRAAKPVQTAAAVWGLYVLVTALSLPGAALLTLVVGALFGLVWGTLLVSFASSLGATLAFLAARYVARDAVQQRYGDRLKAINQGVRQEGAWYLLSLRLIPVFPFFLVNLLMGLTPMRTWTYYWVSQLGMLAGTVVYVNAGTRLAQLRSVSDIVSPAVWGSFVLLGLFPLLARQLVARWRRRRVYARWRRPRRFDRNLIVIGGGAAGLVGAYIAAAVKAKVTLVEAHRMGGDCLHHGCVPSKALIKSARVAHQIRHAARYGLRASAPQVDFKDVMARVHAIIATVAPHDSVERYTQLGVEVLQGYARIKDPWTVEVALPGDSVQRLTTRSILIAAGAQPIVPPLPGLDDVGYVTSDTVWDRFARLDAAPGRLVVLGGGPVGCELAQAFARLGSHVTLIGRNPRLMPREDEDVSERVRAALQADGVTVLTGCQALRCETEGPDDARCKFIVVAHNGVTQRLAFDQLLCAVGRRARLDGYGLEELGIETRDTVVTNACLQTLYPNIYAAGDVASADQFTHAAGHRAWYAAVNALFGDLKCWKVDDSIMPRATFVDPEVACVGLNESQARDQGIAYDVTTYDIADLDRAIADGTANGFVKVLTVPGKDRILGVTIVGEHAADLLAEFVLAMKHGLGLSKILGTIHVYPTLAEANKYVAGAWKRAHAPQTLLAWLARYHDWRRG